jgi:hypothetical protein
MTEATTGGSHSGYASSEETLWSVEDRAEQAVQRHAEPSPETRRAQLRLACKIAARRRATSWVR